MRFNSFPFIFVFLPVAAVGYAVAVRRGSAQAGVRWLLLASLVFYAWARPTYVPWLLGSIALNRLVDLAMDRGGGPAVRKRWLVFGLVMNVALLAGLKYTNFFLATFHTLLGAPVRCFDIALPLGVSFFTLQQVMYLMDRYEGLVGPTRLVEYATFTAFFPTVSSGPIPRAKQVVPQLRAADGATDRHVAQGLTLLALGLTKKVVLADSFGRLADAGFGSPDLASTFEAWAASISYSCQIYFDFSGYSDMAVASGLLLGIVLPTNFDAPYRSRSVTEFWQRWHITLSQFITTYLYTPLIRGRRVTLVRASLATMVAMGIAGLWHGPSWTFVVFGLLHGVGLVCNQVWRRKVKMPIPAFIAWPATMLFVNTGFVFFRADSVGAAVDMCRQLVSLRHVWGLAAITGSVSQGMLVLSGVPIAVGLVAAVAGPTSMQLIDRTKPSALLAMAVCAAYVVAFLFLNSTMTKEFVYFAF